MTDEENIPELPESVVPWWQDGETTSEETKEPFFLSGGVFRFLKRVREWMLFPLQQTDAMTCNERMLNLLAWDRDITRFENEPESLFKRRVKYAFLNARDAGCKQGFQQIFERLDLNIIGQHERLYPAEWDVISIEMPESDNEIDTELLNVLIEQYGRTCRRYEPTVQNTVETLHVAVEFNCEWQTVSASMPVEYTVDDDFRVSKSATEFNHSSENYIATWE